MCVLIQCIPSSSCGSGGVGVGIGDYGFDVHSHYYLLLDWEPPSLLYSGYRELFPGFKASVA